MSDRRSYKAKDIYLSKKSANVALVKVRASHLDLFLSRALSVDIRKIESSDGKRAVYHSVVHSNLEQPETVLIRTKRITTGVSLESLYEAMPVKDSEVDINVNVFSEYDAFSLVKFTSYDGQINTDLNVETKFVNVIVEFETSADLDTFIESKVYSLEDIGLTVNVVSDYDPTIIIPEDKDLTVFVLSSYDAVASVMEEINMTVDATSIYDAEKAVVFTEFNTDVNTEMDVDIMEAEALETNVGVNVNSTFDAFTIYVDEEVDVVVNATSDYEAETVVLFVEYNTDVDTDVQVDTLESALEEVDITITASSNYDAEGLVVFVEYETSVDTDTTVEIMTSQVEEVNTTTVASSDYDAITIYVDEAVGIGVSVSSDYDAETVVVFTDYETDVSTELDVETVASELEDVDMTTVVSSDYDADTIVKFVEYETFVNTDVDVDTMVSVVEDINTTITSSSNYDGFVILQEEVNTTVDVSSEYEAIVPILYENDFEQYSDFDNLTNEDWTMLLSETGDLLQARNRAATDFGDVSLFFYNEFFIAGTSIWKWDEVSLPSQTDGQLLIRQTPDNSNDEIIHLMKSGEFNGSFYGLGFARDCDNNVAKIVHFDGDHHSYNTLVDTSLDGIIGTQETVWWRFIIEEQTDGSFDLTLRLATVLDGSNEGTLLTTNYDGNLASPTAPFSEAWNVVYGTQSLWLDYYAATPTAGYNIPYPEPF